MTNDLDTLATALYARIDDELKASPWVTPARPVVGIVPTLSDAELIMLAVMSALPGYTSERRLLRRVERDFRRLFPCVRRQSGYNGFSPRTPRCGAMTGGWWIPPRAGCRCPHETAKRSGLAGWAQYGYCAPHSRYFWGLRLHLVCTLAGLPVLFALTGAKADERETLRDMPDTAPDVTASRPGQTIIGDKNHHGRESEHDLAGVTSSCCARPAKAGRSSPGAHLFKPLRQVTESVNQTFKGQLDLERHGGKAQQEWQSASSAGSALTAAIWHNDKTGHPIKRFTNRLRSLTATTPPGLIHLVDDHLELNSIILSTKSGPGKSIITTPVFLISPWEPSHVYA